jgi:hypothetical protein
MKNHSAFIFKDYNYDSSTQTVVFNYSIDDSWHFTESYTFNTPLTQHNPDALDRSLQVLFFIAGISYYKTFIPPNIIIGKGSVDEKIAHFLNRTYQKGLREFFYRNNLDVLTPINFPVTSDFIDTVSSQPQDTLLIAIGGGKDSLLSYELAKDAGKSITTWSLGHKSQLVPLIERMESNNHIYVERNIDPQLLTIPTQGAYNGHIPISAIFAAVSSVLSVLTNSRDSVMSNEQSANEPTLRVGEVAINHQYSKSQEFERDYQDILNHIFGNSYRYYSLLRPYSEARITELFSQLCFIKYSDTFSSCNHAFSQKSTTLSWCGQCPKCAFTFLALSAFLPQNDVQDLWNGKNLLLDPRLNETYLKLLGLTTNGKPFECVGEIKESRSLMRMVAKKYPILSEKYSYDIPEGYDWRVFMNNEIPVDVIGILPK